MVKPDWTTLGADGFKPPFSSGKEVSVLTVVAFDLDKKTAEGVVNLAGFDILTIAYKKAGRRRGWRANRQANRYLLPSGRF